VSTVEIPKYEKKIIIRDITIAIGIDFCGFFASSPENNNVQTCKSLTCIWIPMDYVCRHEINVP
jgi:hypothetical protein